MRCRCTVFKPGGKKLLAKGHVISDEDIRVLESEGMENVWVTELEEGEVSEDDAVMAGKRQQVRKKIIVRCSRAAVNHHERSAAT